MLKKFYLIILPLAVFLTLMTSKYAKAQNACSYDVDGRPGYCASNCYEDINDPDTECPLQYCCVPSGTFDPNSELCYEGTVNESGYCIYYNHDDPLNTRACPIPPYSYEGAPDAGCRNTFDEATPCCLTQTALITPTLTPIPPIPTPTPFYCCNNNYIYCDVSNSCIQHGIPPDTCPPSRADAPLNCTAGLVCDADAFNPRGYCVTPTPMPSNTFTCSIGGGSSCYVSDNNCVPGCNPINCSGGIGEPTCIIGTYDCDCSATTPTLPITPRPMLAYYCDSYGNPTTATPAPGQLGRIYTAIGCIPVSSQNDFLAFVLKWALGIGGGIAMILIIFAGFLIMTSGGDKQKLQAGKELLTAAVSGLLLIIFSVFILDLFGIRILRIPGL